MVTIKDVAKAAGVGIATVSRALNNEPGVNENTRRKIAAIAKELNYVPNMAAKWLTDKKSNSIGIIWYQPKGLFYTHLCQEIQNRAASLGYHVLVSYAPPDTAMRLLHDHFIDKILYWVGPEWKPSLDFLKSRELFQGKMLLMGGGTLEGAHRIAIDRKDAVLKAVAHLAGLGHRRIAFVGDTASEKFTGYTLGLLEYQLEYNPGYIVPIRGKEHFTAVSEDAIVRALRGGGSSANPTALIVDSQGLLSPVLQTLRKHHIRIPEQVSLIVYDNIPEAEQLTDVPLTTVGPNIRELAERAIDILIGETAVDDVWCDMTVPTELIERQSILAAKAYE